MFYFTLLLLDVPEKCAEIVTSVESSISSAGTSKPNLSPKESQDVPENELHVGVKPTAPPRKSSTPKRRAPAPPPSLSSKTETSAVIHQAEDLQKQTTVYFSSFLFNE